MKSEMPKPILLKEYAPPPFLIDSVYLDFDLHPTATRVRSRLKLRPNSRNKRRVRSLVLDGEELTLEYVRVDGVTLGADEYAVTADKLTIFDVPNRPFSLEVATTCNPEINTSLSGLYRSKGVYCTQCEAEGFRRITYFLDRPDVLAVYTTRIEADVDDASVLLGNGNPSERGTRDGGRRHYAIWRDPHPKPSYLFALVGGNLTSMASTFTTMSGRQVDLRIFVEPGKEKRCAFAMDALKRSMRWDEQRFGREYDLDVFNIVAVSDFNMGAMENKGLNIFNDRLVLASPDTATDQNYADIERVIAHEYFHNWTGNRITCRDWFQLCLKEGLTVYRDQEFSADMRSRTVQRIADVRNLKARQFAEDAGPLAHPVRPESYIEINNFYTATVYDKGAELVRMLATMIGEQAFRRGMDLYFLRHDGQAATVEQFVTCFADVSNRDLRSFMNWYSQAGTPHLVASLKHDPRSKTAELTVEQITPSSVGGSKRKSATVPVPIRMGLVGPDGQDLPLVTGAATEYQEGVVIAGRRSQKFRFKGIEARPVPSLLRGFSAPVNLTIDLSDGDLAFLMGHDPDLYNRWQASQDYAMRLLVEATEAKRAGKSPPSPAAFIAALKRSAFDEALEPAYRAQMLALPGQGDIARVIAREVDPAAVYAATRWLGRQIGVAIGQDLVRLYTANASQTPYSPDAEQSGRRALRNRALGLLFLRGQPSDLDRTLRHFERARNATDETLGLALLATIDGPARAVALERFYGRWKADHLMIDHWFAVQAMAPQESTLSIVQTLTGHRLFSLTNPNKVRSLLFTFASANPVNFNRPDGAGYAFIAEQVRQLDRINPQMAARLAGSFRNWRVMEADRRRQAEKTLRALARTPRLSRDVYEIVSKTLD